jgi:hypothetical protein
MYALVEYGIFEVTTPSDTETYNADLCCCEIETTEKIAGVLAVATARGRAYAGTEGASG